MGETLSNPEPDAWKPIIDQVDSYDDPEHPDVSLTHESEWCLLVFAGGHLVWEDLEQGEPRHLVGVDRHRIESLWHALASGDLLTVEQEDWQPGYGNAS